MEESLQPKLNLLVKGAGLMMLGLVVGKLLGYLFKLVIARYLGVENYGVFTLGFTILGLTSLFCLLGLPTAAERFVNIYKGDDKRVRSVLQTVLGISIGLSIIFAMIITLLHNDIAEFFNKPEMAKAIFLFGLTLPFFVTVEILTSVFKAFKRIELNVYFGILLGGGLRIALALGALALGYGLEAVLIVYLMSYVITSLLEIMYVHKRIISLSHAGRETAHVAKEVLVYSWPLFFSTALFALMTWIDTVLLGYFRTTEEVGIYGAAIATTSLVTLFFVALTTLVNPILTELLRDQKLEELREVYLSITRWTIVITLPVLISIIVLGENILTILFGADFAPGHVALVLLSVGYFGTIAIGPAPQAAEMAGYQKKILKARLAATGTNFLLDIILIPQYTYIGAGIATCIAMILYGFLTWRTAHQKLGVKPVRKSILKVLAIGAGVGLLSYMIIGFIEEPLGKLIIGLTIIFVGYALLFRILRCFEPEDIRTLQAIERKLKMEGKFSRMLV